MNSHKNKKLPFILPSILILIFFSFTIFSSPLTETKLTETNNHPAAAFRIARNSPSSISERAKTAQNLLSSILKNDKKAEALLQYGVTAGYTTLRSQIAQIADSRGIEANYKNNISIFNGRDDMLDTLGRIFINPNDKVFVYKNSELSREAIKHFSHHNADVLGVNTLEELKNSINMVKENNQFYNNGNHPKSKLIYADSSVMSTDEIIELKEIADENGLIVIEDATSVSPVSKNAKNIKSLDDSGTVIYMGNLDSVLGEGLQTSYIIGANKIMRKLEWAKGAQTLHPNAFSQVLISEYLEKEAGIKPQGEKEIFETNEYRGDMDYYLSKTGEELQESAIRGILKIIQNEKVISLAGGIPAPELFPAEKLSEIVKNMTLKEWSMALDRVTSEGNITLRQSISNWLQERGMSVDPQEVLITSGSQNGLDIIARVFNKVGQNNATVFTPDPVYLGAANAFRTADWNVQTYKTLEELKNKLNKLPPSERFNTLIYLTPTFANPAGDVIPLKQRKEYLKIAEEYGVKIIEDNPYGELRYKGKRIPTILSLDEDKDNVIYFTSNSKVLSPGMRIGYIVGKEDLVNSLSNFKNRTIGATNSLVQVIISKFLEDSQFNLDNHVNDKLIPTYTKRKDAMLDALSEAKNKYNLDIDYTPSEGGLFVWVELPEQIDTEELLTKTASEEHGVMLEDRGEKVYAAFVPGTPFSVEEGSHSNYMRLCFSTSSEEKIRTAVFAIMQAVRDELN